MTLRQIVLAGMTISLLTACSGDGEAPEQPEAAAEPPVEATANPADVEAVEITAGLSSRKLRNGYGGIATAGDTVEVHYTGWLYDEAAENNRGQKFDSSVDRGQRFQFVLGEGRVIKGWDQGVDGMMVGEKRELMIAPEMAYGERGAGGVIPPGATLVFEVELLAIASPDEASR